MQISRKFLGVAMVVLVTAVALVGRYVPSADGDEAPQAALAEQPREVSSTDVAENQNAATVAEQGSNVNPAERPFRPSVTKESLCYDGKKFDEWRMEFLTELKPELRTEAIKAFRVFARNGYDAEVTAIILETMRAYDSLSPQSRAEGILTSEAFAAISSVDRKISVPALIGTMTTGNHNVRRFAIGALGQIRPPAKDAVPFLMDLVENEDVSIRISAMTVINSINRDTVGFMPALKKALKDEQPTIVTTAIACLVPFEGYMKYHEPFQAPYTSRILQGVFVPELVEALDHDDAGVRQRALVALGALCLKKDEPEAVKAVIEALDHQDHIIRRQSLRVLTKLGPYVNEAFPAVVGALQHKDPEIQNNARTDMLNIPRGTLGVLPALIVGFQKGSAADRRVISGALHKMGPAAKEAAPLLRRALSDADENLRKVIDRALKAIEQ